VTTLQAMVSKAAEACPTLLSPSSPHLSDLRQLAESKAAARLPPDFVKNLVANTLGLELTNKVGAQPSLFYRSRIPLEFSLPRILIKILNFHSNGEKTIEAFRRNVQEKHASLFITSHQIELKEIKYYD